VSTTASATGRAQRFFHSTIGKKAIMAVTGVILFGFVVGHLLGNLQVYLGPEKLDAYGAFLHHTPSLLWGTRAVLLACIVLHVLSATQLTLISNEARPHPYAQRRDRQATYASRTMMWSGAIIIAFVVYHLLHFTFGSVHSSFIEGAVYHNVVTGFRVAPVSITYIIAMVLLGMHLQHGLWSMLQSLGLMTSENAPLAKSVAAGIAWAIVAGNCSIPIAVLLGVVGHEVP
jgi:succinate dehydrogenase / fumarate reductase cytochrome b subunit